SADWVRLVQARDLTILGAHLTTVAEREASAARWTFQQEASLFLDFLRRGRLRVDDLVTWAARPDECNPFHEQPAPGRSKPIGIVFQWKPEPAESTTSSTAAADVPAP